MKNLDYYLNLPYKIEVNPIPEQEGGGFMAIMPEIGKFAMIGDGDTPEEAISKLKDAQKEQFQEWIDEQINIPEPADDQNFSGRFIVRVPKSLHRELVSEAKREGASLNQLVTYLLSSANERIQLQENINQNFQYLKKEMEYMYYKKFSEEFMTESLSPYRSKELDYEKAA